MKTRQEKVKIVNDFQTIIQSQEFAVLVNYKGCDVLFIQNLRKQLHNVGGSLKVMKNSLLKLSFQNSNFVNLSDRLVGQNAILYGEEIFKILKVVNDSSVNIVGAVLGEKVLDNQDLNRLSKITSVEELYQVLQLSLISPIRKLQSVITITSKLIIILKGGLNVKG